MIRLHRAALMPRPAASCLALLCFALCLALVAPPAQADNGAARTWDIPAGPLDAALERVARRAGLTLSFDPAAVSGLTTSGLDGEYTVSGVLRRLLAGTELEHRFSDDSTVAIAPRTDAERLGRIDVTARPGAGYTADGLATGVGEGYGLTNLEAPVSSSGVSRELIEEQGANRLRETLRNVPGVDFAGTYNNNYDNFRIRGFELPRINGFQRNGAPVVHLQQPSFFPVERVEVLKGPASILNGQLNPGGVINVRTWQPSLTRFRRLTAGYDSFGQGDAAVNVGGPIEGADGAAYRLVAGVLDGDTFKDRVEEHERSLYGSILWPLAADTDLIVTLETSDREDIIDDGVVSADRDDPLGAAGKLPRSRFLGEPVDSEYDNDHFSLELETLLGAWEAEFSYSYSRNQRRVRQVRPNDFGHDSPFVNDDGRTVRRFTNAFIGDREWQTLAAEFRRSFETGPVEHRLGLGADFRLQRNAGTLNSFVADFGTFDGDPSDDNDVDPIDLFEPGYGGEAPFRFADDIDPRHSEFAGIHVQDAMHIGDRWVALVGLRYDQDVDRDADERTTAESPRLGAVYRLRPSTSVYASYAESFEPVAGVDRNGDRWEPSRGEQFELGFKQNVFNDALLTAAVFELNKVDELIEDPDDPRFQIQDGERRSRGLEVELSGSVTRRLDMRAGLTHLDTEIVRADANVGNSFGDVPDTRINLWAGYRLEPRLRVGGGVFYTGEQYSTDDNDLELDAYTVVDLFASYRLAQRTTFQVNIDNVFDEKYFVDAGGFAYPGATGIQFGEPLTARFSLAHEF